MADKKIYTIEIQGVKESANAVEALTSQLNKLDAQIKELESKKLDIQGKMGVANSNGNTSTLQEDVALQKELNKLKNEGTALEAKQTAYLDESYQRVLAQKDVLKAIVEDQKAIAAQERLQADTYSNTMQGMKQKLADLKAIINTTDLGDSDQIKKMTQDANELTSKLKEMEEAYGQFGRNVGNYQSAAEGFKNIVIQVNGTERSFANAREASRELNNELKSMALNGQQDTKEFKELQKAVAKLNSDIKDATVSSQGMDKMLDTMQSIVALGSVTQGFSALFGIDDSEIQKSIQKLVALQNALKGIESINQQLKSGEFLGGWLQKGNDAVDKLAASLTSANKAQATLTTTTSAGVTASKSLAAAETAQAAATNTATVATKALSLALKTIGIGLIISAVAALVTYWKDIYKWFTDTVPVLKKLETWFDKIRAVAVGVGTALINYIVQPLATVGKIIKAVIEGNFKDIPSIISEGFKKIYNVIGNYQKGYNKEIERQQEVHNNKMREQQKKANEEAEKDAEAKYGTDLKRTKEYYKKQLALTKEGSEEYKELQRKIWETERREREQNHKKNLANSKKYAKEEAEAENELAKLKVENMKEGLRKTITQLEEERKARLAKLNTNLRNYKELEAQINALYDKKIEEAFKEHTINIEKMYDDMWKNIRLRNIDGYEKSLNILKTSEEQMRVKQENAANKLFNQNISSYGIQGKNQYSPSTQWSLGIISTVKNDEMVEDYKKLIDMIREYSYEENALKNLILRNNNDLNHAFDAQVQFQKYALEERKKQYDDFYSYLTKKYAEEGKLIEANEVFNQLVLESYSKSMVTVFDQRLQAVEAYWKVRIDSTKDYAEGEADTELQIIKKKQKEAVDEENKAWNEQVKIQDEWIKKKKEGLHAQAEQEKWSKEELDLELLNADKEYDKAARELLSTHIFNLEVIKKEYAQKETTIENEKNEKLKKVNAEYYQDALQEFRDFQTALSNLASKQPVMNAWGFTNWKQTNANNRELLSGYEELARQLNEKRLQLTNDFQGGIIDKTVYQSSLREMDSFVADLGDKMDKVKYELSLGNQIGTFIQEAQQYISALGNSLNSLLSTIWSAADAEYDYMMNQLQKEIDAYEDALDKQKQATQEYADNVNSIEDELKTARGDRRQQLIDNLNAQMAAQRASLAEEKRIEREEQKLKDKKEKEEEQQRKKEKDRAVIQAIISTALAVTNALATQPFVPVGIAMGSLAAALGAAQIAIMKSQKYADGGVIQGKSHSQGGVKVLGGRAEVEGGEYITNKVTTNKNVEVLDFINSRRKKLTLDDFVDFYVGGKSPIKKNIQLAKAKFADGGVIPSLRTDIDLNERLIAAFEDYSNRPSIVSVVDIIDRTQAVNDVRVIAGINQ